jgi:adenine-specific DNA-methyltransferase
MAPRKPPTPAGPTPVSAIVHPDKRTNIPTADAQEYLVSDGEQVTQVRWARDASLDPQLVWKGKDAQGDELVADAPPIFIQEKIDPRVLVENLRNTAGRLQDEPELTLFDTFDGLTEMDVVDFYRHDANWSNRMVLGDSLQVMSSLGEREGLRGKVQMIYLDPPYGIKFGSNWQASARKRDVKDGKLEDATFEAEQIKAFRDTWELGIHSYLGYLRDRLVAARDLLTESGSIFVQIGDENVHLVRAVMDEVFGRENFVSQIVFKTTSSATSQYLAGVADLILWFSRDRSALKYRPTYRTKALDGAGGGQYTWVEHLDGSRSRSAPAASGDRPLRFDQLTSQRPPGDFPVEHEGRTFRPAPGFWKTHADGMRKLELARRLSASGKTLTYVRYLEDFCVFPYSNIWDDTVTSGFGDPKTYVVQTNTKVIERCMLMCTDPGDLVLDPTCGSGTTAYVAEQWGRRWITIDTSRVALALARQRLMGAKFPYFLLADSPEGRRKETDLSGALAAGPTGGDIRKGFVYERVQHITLKSIANNPDIREGMTRGEIDAAIKRHAEYELLYDKPYEDRKKVRVTGPFTVESLSPHRAIAFSGQVPDDLPRSEAAADLDGSGPSFEQTILNNLAKAGIQNGVRNERLVFDTIEPHAGNYLQAIADRAGVADGAPGRVALAIGPQYGTVGPSFIKNAVLEVIRNGDKSVGLLCVLAFAFDPLALGALEDIVDSERGFATVQAERSIGPVQIQLVRMNSDLLMGEDLKKTGAGNLFTVFGEPDIAVTLVPGVDGAAEQVVVEILGVDVYDPTTGEVRSNNTDLIALWMIDTDYNGESFFVRHCYFTGGNDPYARLKKALKADIDEDAWATLYRTSSRPFAVPGTRRIAVKVINDYGDEVMKVIEVAAEMEGA